MRCYLVDELQPEVIANLEAQLTKNGCQYGTSVNDCSSKFSFCLFRNLILFFLGQWIF